MSRARNFLEKFSHVLIVRPRKIPNFVPHRVTMRSEKYVCKNNADEKLKDSNSRNFRNELRLRVLASYVANL